MWFALSAFCVWMWFLSLRASQKQPLLFTVCMCLWGWRKGRCEKRMEADGGETAPTICQVCKGPQGPLKPKTPMLVSPSFWPPHVWVMTRISIFLHRRVRRLSGLEWADSHCSSVQYLLQVLLCLLPAKQLLIFYLIIHWGGRSIIKQTHGILTNFFLHCLPVLKVFIYIFNKWKCSFSPSSEYFLPHPPSVLSCISSSRVRYYSWKQHSQRCFTQVNQSSLTQSWVSESTDVPRRGGKNLLHDLRGDDPEITYSLLLMLVSTTNLEFDSTSSVHPYGRKWDWAAESYLNDSTNSHQTVLGGYQATASKASRQFSLGSLSSFQSTFLCLAYAFCL